MKLVDIIQILDLTENTTQDKIAAQEVTGGYVSDLLSDVMANAQKGNVWVTSQSHQNIVAVASLLELSAVVLTGGIQPDEETLIKARANSIILLTTSLSGFDLVGSLYQLGVRGGADEP